MFLASLFVESANIISKSTKLLDNARDELLDAYLQNITCQNKSEIISIIASPKVRFC